MIATNTQLEQMQKIELAMFKVFVDICQRLNLRYYVLYGTLLGAVRHQGFIPWDDDIDVGMPREDYEVFLKEAGKLLPEGLFLQSYHTEPEYHANAAKIRNDNTTYIESAVRNLNIHHGIFMDIFPLDYYPDKRMAQIWLELRRKIYSLRISSVLITDREENRIKRWVKETLKVLLRRVYPTALCAVRKKDLLFKGVPRGNRKVNYCGMWEEKEIVPSEWFAEGKTVMFEGIPVTAPKEYEKWLTQIYGDYMQLPPIEKRVTHHLVEMVDLEKSYTVYEGVYWKTKEP